ncbi:hypothetical protein [Bacillus sp. FJAT-27245]|uniref:hypothetical protein n=1 Tax=Bacillus sp. FJAT-27245 TaxID=1684144 RepID=UPI001E4BB89D|nr:hypothetical protein [Bacillus sp. FJAT-27245]
MEFIHILPSPVRIPVTFAWTTGLSISSYLMVSSLGSSLSYSFSREDKWVFSHGDGL